MLNPELILLIFSALGLIASVVNSKLFDKKLTGKYAFIYLTLGFYVGTVITTILFLGDKIERCSFINHELAIYLFGLFMWGKIVISEIISDFKVK